MRKLFFAVVAVAGLVSCNQDKIAYVDTVKLLDDYQERKDIESKFKNKLEKFDIRRDSISKSFDMEVKDFQSKAASMGQAKAQQESQRLQQKQQILGQQLQQEEYGLNQSAQQEIDTLKTKVRKFIRNYGEENKYTFILTAQEGNGVMYGEESKNITKELLEKLNDEYARK